MMGARAAAALRLIILLGASGADAACATTPSFAEPARPADVPGLVPLAPAPSPSASAPASEPLPAVSQTRTPPAPTMVEPTPPTPIHDSGCAARVGVRAVRRSALSRTLDAGLGTWLRGVDVEPKVDHGRFQGWLVRGIYAGDPCWAGIDLRAGDVVNRVNRRPIERPEEAQAVWTALRGTGEIVIDLVRAGRPRTLRFDVVDDPE